MKNYYKIILKLFKWINALLFFICIYLSIKWSDSSIINLPSCVRKMFLKPDNVDSTISSLVTGYISGYTVYILTVVIPIILKNGPMKIEAAKYLAVIYRKAILIVLLMCKNACTKAQWNEIVTKTDLECFNDKYYLAMRQFDIKSEAETVLLHKDTMQPFEWHEYLSLEFNQMQNELDRIFLQFHAYLSDDILMLITDIKNCKLFGIFTMVSNKMGGECIVKDGYRYFDTHNLMHVYTRQLSRPIFAEPKEDYPDHIEALREFVSLLISLFKFLNRFPKGISVEKDFAISLLKKHKAGHYGTARFKDK